MTELARALATLRIVGDDLVPDEVSQLLGCEPTTGWAKGETRTFAGSTRTTSFGKWSLQTDETTPADIDVQVTDLLRRLNPDLAVWAQLGDRYDINLFCGWFMQGGNEGVTLAPESMTALGSRGVRLEVDLYAGDGPED